MIGNTIPLNVDVNARGVATVRSQLGQVETAVARVGRSAGGLSTVMGRLGGGLRAGLGGLGTAVGGVGRWAGRTAMSLPGMMGIGLGVAGFASLIKETADYDSALVSMQLALRMTDQEAADLNDDMARLAKETGKSRGELLAAARAATDFGVPLNKAVEGLRDAALLAQVMGVPLESLAPALGGLEKLSNGTLTSRQQMAMLYEAQNASGLPEDQLLRLIAQLGPELAGITGGDQRSLAFLMSNISAVGEAFSGPKGAMKLKSGIETLAMELNNPRNAKLFERLNIDTSDLADAEGKLLTALASGDEDVLKLSSGLTDFLGIVMNSEGGMERFNDTFEATTGDLGAATERVTGALDKMEGTAATTWGQIMEEFKAPLMDLARGGLAWLVDHKEEIIAGGKALIETLKSVAAWLKDWWPVALAAALAGKAIPVAAAIAGGGAAGGALALPAVAAVVAAGDTLWEWGKAISEHRMPQTGLTQTLEGRFLNPSRRKGGAMEQIGGVSAASAATAEMQGIIGEAAGSAAAQMATANMRTIIEGSLAASQGKIEIHVHTSPDGAFTTALRTATGRMVPTTTTTDGRQTVAAVG